MVALRTALSIGSSATGVLFLTIALLLLILVPYLVNEAVLERSYLGYNVVNGTEVPTDTTKQWAEPPYDLRMNIWLYNTTNPRDVLQGAKPHLEEIGPFVFIERQKKSFEFTHNDTRVVYQNNHRYYFNASLSCANCSLNSTVTVPNVIFQKLVDIAEQGVIYKIAVNALLAVASENVFVTAKAGELLFDGYHDPLIDFVCKNAVLKFLCSNGVIPEKIGFFYGQNDTADGSYDVGTGLHNPSQLGHVFLWNNVSRVKNGTWDDEYAEMINGTDGQLFHPMLERKALTIFGAQACRSIEFLYVGDSTFHDIPAYRYVPSDELFDTNRTRGFCNVKNTPTFFNESIQQKGCMPRGLLDASRCLPANPRVYLSKPHFLDAHPAVREALTGMNEAVRENDQLIVEIEPTTGAPVHAKRLMQINVGVVKSDLSVLSKLSGNMIVPVMWFNESAVVDEATRSQLVNELYAAKHWTFTGGIVLLVFGIVLIATGIVLFKWLKPRPPGEDEDPIIGEVHDVMADEQTE